jgi:hypothetical protein
MKKELIAIKCYHSQTFRFVILLIFACQLFPARSLAQWSANPTVNNAICTTVSQQSGPQITSDGSGGAIIAWSDYNLTTGAYSISAQRISWDGIVLWTANGVDICSAPQFRSVPQIISDGSGGAIIVWQDNRSGTANIFAQRFNSNGLTLWTANGIPVCEQTKDQTFAKLVSDGSGGAIITWQDLRNGSSYVIYAQRINATGSTQWTAEGVAMRTPNTSNDELPQIISDGNGGAIIAWHQYHGVYPNGNLDIYVQQVNSNGIIGWGSDGNVICALTSDQRFPQLITDGSNGAIIVWEDYRNGPSISNLHAQKVNATGVIQWALNGVAIAPGTIHQTTQKLLKDGSGGAYITWESVGNLVVYAQLINSGGVRQWATNGVSIGAAGNARGPQIVSDGGTGAIITWYDFSGTGNGDIFAQHINLAGTVLWPVNGAGVCTDQFSQRSPVLTENGNGGAIITWWDLRNNATNSSDIYAQMISATGTLGVITGVNDNKPSLPATVTLEQNYPNPFILNTRISFAISGSSFVSLKVYNTFGQEISTLVNREMSPGSYSFDFDAHGLPDGVYIYCLRSGGLTATRVMILMK